MQNNKSPDDVPVGPSNRSFGLIVGGIFLLIEAFRFWKSEALDTAGIVLLVISLPLIAGALTYPPILTPFNKAWMKLGLLLHKIVNPIVMFVLYAGAICTTGFILRMLGKDPLRLKLDPDAKSYWLPREHEGPAPETMKNQF
ncbi:hypothetical protein LPB41_29060 [Thalassospira sp. MA62]|nr:hypothetical protein [Thalassospira sp. MA62]